MKHIETSVRAIQVFPLVEGQVGVGATDGADSDGVFTGISLIDCVTDGSIIFTFASGGTETVAFTSEQKYGVYNLLSLDIQSGTFNLA